MGSKAEEELDDWMSRLADGEREAFDPLFRALHPRALRVCGAKLPPDQAADAAQAILMKVFARASDFEQGKPVLPWFYAIAANELRTVERRRRNEARRAADGAVTLAAADSPERELLEAELRACLAGAIDALDATSADAIASLLDERRPDVAGPTFRKRVSRAYARLRLLLGGFDAK